jgi:isoleucyl-tRNA synthetase
MNYTLVQTFNPYTHLPVIVILAKDLIGKWFIPVLAESDFAAYQAGD